MFFFLGGGLKLEWGLECFNGISFEFLVMTSRLLGVLDSSWIFTQLGGSQCEVEGQQGRRKEDG